MSALRFSYLSPRTEVRESPIHGRGLFARAKIDKDEIVAVKGGHIVDRKTLREEITPLLGPVEIQIDDHLFIAPVTLDERELSMLYSNHSCDANVGMRGEITFVAMREIRAGEELTHDWCTTDNDDYSVECKCRSANCRKTLTGKDWQQPGLQQKYAGYFSAYLAEKIALLATRIVLTGDASRSYQSGNTVSLMSKSYFPTDQAGRIDWYKNFAKEFPKVGKDLGFSDTEITNAMNDSKYAVYILNVLGPEIDSDPGHAANAVLSGQSSGDYVDLHAGGDAPTPVRPGIDTRRQARVERIKAQKKFNADTGNKLKITSGKFEADKYKAELGRARLTGNFVTIPFRKAGGGISGINLYRQHKGEKSAHKVGFFFRTPAIDTEPGKSGEITYTAHAVIDGKEIGQPSDPVKISVS